MKYTASELGNIQLMAKQVADIAALAQAIGIFGQEEHKEKHLDYYYGELQKHFSTLHSHVIGDMEAVEVPLRDCEEKDSLAVGSGVRSLLAADYIYYNILVEEISEQGAIDELSKVLDGDKGITGESGGDWAFSFEESPQGAEFWQRILG